MSNRRRATGTVPPPPVPSPDQPASRPTRALLLAVLPVAVLIAAVIAIVATRGSDDENVSAGGSSPAVTGDATSGTGDTSSDGASGTGSGAASETQPVSVTGDALARFDDTENDPAVGTQAPALAGSAFDGSAASVTPGDGQAHLLLFVAHWCPHCQAEVPRIVEWIAAGNKPDGLVITAVATGTQSDAPNFPPSQWLADENWPEPVLADDGDGSAASAYGLSAYPYFVLVGPDGTVRLRETGEIDPNDLTNMIEQALA